MKVYFLNVGHGDMSLVDFDGVFMLIDCKVTSTDDDAFKFIDEIISAPEGGGNKKLDYLVVTHTDKDHITGLDTIDENFEIGQIWESGYRRSDDAEESPEYDVLLDLIERISTKQLKAGSSKLSFSHDGVDAFCLCSKSNDNDEVHYNSLVLKFVKGEKSVIFAGDSNCEAWKNKVVANYPDMLDADILHASHHGSRSFFFEESDSDKKNPYTEAIESISPEYTIISGCDPEDKKDKTWPPHDDAIELYQEYSSDTGGVYITGKDGHLTFDISEKIELNSELSENYVLKKGKYNRYSKLKAPFVAGIGSPKGKITDASFGK
ncbi:MAG: MBL fold metallo-hydrolase [Parabacteroides sp.]|nr:MBL fold metallo-hydrolase [Parabacteroides sp.]